jgi:hypothetical protein
MARIIRMIITHFRRVHAIFPRNPRNMKITAITKRMSAIFQRENATVDSPENVFCRVL